MVTAKKLNSGNWRCQVYDYTDENGKKHYKSFTAHSQREAEYQALVYQMQRENERNHMTLGQAYDEYVRLKYKSLSPSTRRGYKSARKNHFQSLMNMVIADITEAMVEQAMDIMAMKYAPKTIRNQYGILSSVLKKFRKNFHMEVSLPRKQTPRPYIPSSVEVKALYDAADEYLRVPIILASQASLRCSEIAAITPDRIIDRGVIVNSAIVEDENHVYVRKPPKTEAGERFTPLGPDAVAICREWAHFGINPNSLEKRFHTLCKRVGIPTTLHKLRHYWATQLHQAGIPDKVIMKYGGWDDVNTLHKIYLHVLSEHDVENEDRIVNTVGMNKNAQSVTVPCDISCDTAP